MNCPYCANAETKVIDSREAKDGSNIKRRRECSRCSKRFSTIERVLKLDLEVTKSNGSVEEFKLEKLKRSLIKACDKRPVTLEQIDEIVSKTLEDLKQVKETQIPTSLVGKSVLVHLKELDEIAFLKYSIVHNKYCSIEDFVGEIEQLKDFDKLKS